jgi:hypothetical protein
VQAVLRQEAEERERIRLQDHQVVEGMMDQILDNNVAHFQTNVASMHSTAHQRLDAVERPLLAIQEQSQQLDREINALGHEIQDLRTQLRNVDDQIDGAKADNIQLQIAIKETEQAIKNRDKGGFGDIFSAIAAIAVCATASWGIKAILDAMGATSVKVGVSAIRGGAKTQLIFTGL